MAAAAAFAAFAGAEAMAVADGGVPSATAREGQSALMLGRGLAISKAIVDAHGGSLKATNSANGGVVCALQPPGGS